MTKTNKKINGFIAALILVGTTSTGTAQQQEEPISSSNTHVCIGEELTCSHQWTSASYYEILKEATKLSIMELLVVSELPRTYARSCSERVFGCEAHIDAVVDLFFEQYEKRGIDPLILAAMAKHETNFNPFAVNDVYGAAGLLQLLPSNRHAAGVRFIHSRAYRESCRSDYYACQGEVVEASVTLLERSIRRCDNDLRHGLGMYGSGSCEGSRRFSKYVIRVSNELRQRQAHYVHLLINDRNIQSRQMCDITINNHS